MTEPSDRGRLEGRCAGGGAEPVLQGGRAGTESCSRRRRGRVTYRMCWESQEHTGVTVLWGLVL